MNSYKKLINNSLIFTIGNLGAKIILFFLVPLYTHYLTPSEYGIVELLTTTINIVIPILSLSIIDSVLRFVMDKNYDNQSVLINSLFVMIFGLLLLLVALPLFEIILPYNEYIHFFYLIFLVQMLNSNFNQYIRAKGQIKLFALSGITNALALLISNLILLVFLKLGMDGYFLSIIISNIISGTIIFLKGKIWLDLKVNKINLKLMREMLLYSIPLIPNAIMWWAMSSLNRYMIVFFLGLSANGIYAIASKIPSLLSIINSIFFQAWQMSAIEEANSKEKSKFYTNVFNVFSVFMLITTSIILVHLKLIMSIFSDNYYDSWKYVPFLMLGVVFSSYSSFLGTNYIAAKKTTGVFKTSVVGAIINITLNFLLIPFIGLYGAAIGTMVSFMVIWILRIIDTRNFVTIKINLYKLILSFIIIFIQIGFMYLNFKYEYLILLSIFLLLIIVNYSEIKSIIARTFNVVLKVK